jgi:hypothetical protein
MVKKTPEQNVRDELFQIERAIKAQESHQGKLPDDLIGLTIKGAEWIFLRYAYVLPCDIRQFFPSIDPGVLESILERYIKMSMICSFFQIAKVDCGQWPMNL